LATSIAIDAGRVDKEIAVNVAWELFLDVRHDIRYHVP
jgi:hypothetical protein